MSSKQEKALYARRHQVQTFDPVGSPRKPVVVKCDLCCDQPWVRETTRLDGNWDPIGVIGADGVVRCRECGQPYAPERPVSRGSVIHSSAGMAVSRDTIRPSRAKGVSR